MSITLRSWRYCGSGAVMMRALVAGSAWIWPPVDGWAEALRLAVDAPAPAAAGVPEVAGVVTAPLRDSPAMAARKVVASLVASAFFRYTTWMLPLAAPAPVALGWSSWSTKLRTRASRAGLAARTMSALVRTSGMTVVLNAVSVWPWAAGAAAAPDSIRRCTMGARSPAMA